MQACTEKLGLDVDAGAVPAVPALYGCRSFMDAALARDAVIYFNAGRHEQLVSMTMADYRALAAPRVLPFAQQLDLHIRCGLHPITHSAAVDAARGLLETRHDRAASAAHAV